MIKIPNFNEAYIKFSIDKSEVLKGPFWGTLMYSACSSDNLVNSTPKASK